MSSRTLFERDRQHECNANIDEGMCTICNENHDISVSSEFKNMYVHPRWESARLHRSLSFGWLLKNTYRQQAPVQEFAIQINTSKVIINCSIDHSLDTCHDVSLDEHVNSLHQMKYQCTAEVYMCTWMTTE